MGARAHVSRDCISRYWTLAVTDAFADGVKVQLVRFLPPLEQAPEKTASRPFETVSVIDRPDANGAEPEPPTDTSRPAGLDVTRSPRRPETVNVTVTFEDGAAGPTKIDEKRMVSPRRAESCAVVPAFGNVAIAKLAWIDPDGTVTVCGTLAAPG